MNLKLIALAAVAVVILSGVAYIYKLRADLAEQDTLIDRQAQMIADRDAAIKGYQLAVGQKDQELKAMSAQADHIREVVGDFQRRVWTLEELLADAQNVPAKPGEVIDAVANRKVVGHLNALASVGVRETVAPAGDSGDDAGKIEPLPQAVFERLGAPALGTKPELGPYPQREGDVVQPGSVAHATSTPR